MPLLLSLSLENLSRKVAEILEREIQMITLAADIQSQLAKKHRSEQKGKRKESFGIWDSE